jgi:hypothetical protein
MRALADGASATRPDHPAMVAMQMAVWGVVGAVLWTVFCTLLVGFMVWAVRQTGSDGS